MYTEAILLLASFSSPEKIGTNAASMLWLVPLCLAIAIVYKATKVTKISFTSFTKHVLLLFFTILFVLALAGLTLLILTWYITE